MAEDHLPPQGASQAQVRPLFGPGGLRGPGVPSRPPAPPAPAPPAPVLRWPRPSHLHPRRLFETQEEQKNEKDGDPRGAADPVGPWEGGGPNGDLALRDPGAGVDLAGRLNEGSGVPPVSEAEAALLGATERAENEAAAFQSARQDAEDERGRYVAALLEVTRLSETDLSSLETELTDLSIEVARELFLREVAQDPTYVVRLVEAALKVVTEDEAATVLVASSDHERVERERERLSTARGGALIRVMPDATLHAGECVVQVGRARVDGRLSDRLERVRKALHRVDTETE